MTKWLLMMAVFLTSLSATAQPKPPNARTPAKPNAPAQKPKQPSSNETKVIENTKFHYRFTVPANWQQQQKDDMITLLQLPQADQSSPASPGAFIVISVPACHPDATLTEQVDADKKEIVEGDKDAKIIKDEASSFAGDPSWLLLVDSTHSIEQQTIVKGKTQTKTIKRKQKEMRVVWMHQKNFFEVRFMIDASLYDGRMPLVKRVMDSFQWTDQTKTQ